MSSTKPKVINHINELNLEIDYDKLAKAIVKAQSASENLIQQKMQDKEKLTIKSFFKRVYYIIFNKKQSNGTLTSGLLGGLIEMVFNMIAVLGVLVFVCCIIVLVEIIMRSWTVDMIVYNLISIFLIISCLVVTALFSLIFRGAANEMAIEKDRNYVVAVFSGVVSFAALVVALVALLKGAAV